MLLSFNAIAQDIILKQDGSEIKAKVLEITDQQIKYKDFDFQSGPTRNINIPEVFMITYENGQKEVFNRQTSTPTTPEKEVLSEQISIPITSEEEPFNEQASTPTTPQKTHNTLSSDSKEEFDKIGDDDQKMLFFFKNNNIPKYYNGFESACNQGSIGGRLIGVGIGLTIVSVIPVVYGYVQFAKSDYDYDNCLTSLIVGYSFLGVGQILIIAGVPVSITAAVRKRSIKNDFAKEYFGVEGYTYQPKLNFGATPNGVGLTLNF